MRQMSVLRMRAASAVVGDHMYVCGGHDDFGRPHISVERFDTLSEVWEAQPAMAQGRFNAMRRSDPRTHLRGRRQSWHWDECEFRRAL